MNVPSRLLLLELRVNSKEADRKSYLAISTPSPGGHLLTSERKSNSGRSELKVGQFEDPGSFVLTHGK